MPRLPPSVLTRFLWLLLPACANAPTQQPPTAAALAAAPLQTQDARLAAVRAALEQAGQGQLAVTELAVVSEWDEALIDDFRATTQLRNLHVRGQVQVKGYLQVLNLPQLDQQIGQPGWTPEHSLLGRQLYNALGPGTWGAGTARPFAVVGRFVDLTPGWELLDLESPQRMPVRAGATERESAP